MLQLRAESGGGVLGRGQLAPSPPAMGSGEHCKLPSGVWAESQPKLDLVHFSQKIWQLVTAND